jgi:hypothetical protein
MAMLFIVATFLMVSPVIGKFFIQP